MRYFEIFSGALAGLYAVVPSYGLAIILLTVVVRVLLLPLTIKQTRSMREMQRIQPELKKVQQKYKGNRQKQQEAVMALYKEHGVNPFGGCLPLLMQMPVFIALFHVIRTPLRYMGFALEGGQFEKLGDLPGWIRSIQDSALATSLHNNPLEVNQFLSVRLDCTAQDAFQGAQSLTPGIDQVCGSGLVSALPYLVLVLVMGFTTYYQQKQMQVTRDASDPAARQMQMMTKFMPAVLMFFSFTFPAGLVLYWLVTNLWTIGQQRLLLQPALERAEKPQGKAETSKKPQTRAGESKKASTKPPTVGKPLRADPSQRASGDGQKAPSGATDKTRPSGKKKRKR